MKSKVKTRKRDYPKSTRIARRAIDQGTRDYIVAALSSGIAVNEVARRVGVTKDTVRKYGKKDLDGSRSLTPAVSALKKRIEFRAFDNATRCLDALSEIPEINNATDYRNIAVGFGILHQHARLAGGAGLAGDAVLSLSQIIINVARQEDAKVEVKATTSKDPGAAILADGLVDAVPSSIEDAGDPAGQVEGSVKDMRSDGGGGVSPGGTGGSSPIIIDSPVTHTSIKKADSP